MTPDNNTPWQYRPDNQSSSENPVPEEADESVKEENATLPASGVNEPMVSWTASEYVAHHHGPGWYAGLVSGTVVLAVVFYFITGGSIFSAAIVPILAVIVAVMAQRTPQAITYEIFNDGISVGGKFYPYSQFKSFSVIDEGSLNSILLLPVKRFMPPLSAYYADEDGEKITNALSNFLPFETRKPDVVDRLARRLRF